MKTWFAVAPLAIIFATYSIAQSGQYDQTQNDHTRDIVGKLTDSTGHPISGAVVYLKNTKSLVVKTSVTPKDGNYHFARLSPNIDYEVYAEKEGKKSCTETASAFDSRKIINFTLRIPAGSCQSNSPK